MLAATSVHASTVRVSTRRAACSIRPVRVVRCFASQKPASSPLQSVQQALQTVAKPAVLASVSSLLMALPASADAGKLFDFNLTLPAMATEFLLLMVFLDKFWFGPVGKVLDERDGVIRDLLSSVKDNSGELTRLQEEAEKIIAAARQEVLALIQKVKATTQAEYDTKLADAKKGIESELNVAIAALEKEKEALLKTVDAQADKLTAEILKRVLPAGVRL